MRAMKVIDDPKDFQLLTDETRRKMIFLMRVKERTVSQIAEELGKTPQVIYHHIRKLREAGMVEVAREERIDHFIETYYQATAEVFMLQCGKEGGHKYAEKQMKKALESLAKLGLNLTIDEETSSRVVELMRQIEGVGVDKDWHEKIEGLEDIDIVTRMHLVSLTNILFMSDEQLDEHRNFQKELRDLLRSRLEEPIEAN